MENFVPESFKPIVDKQCKILVLGSLPSIQSLEKHEYYGNRRNRFWSFLFTALGEIQTDDYAQKIQIALKHHIAIWDVVKSATRYASSDATIKNATPNDIPALLAKYNAIQKILFNGSFAYSCYVKFFGVPAISYIKLLSTSPACAGRDEEKLKYWCKALQSDFSHI